MREIFTTTLRLNLSDEEDRKAYERLRKLDKRQYRSYSKAIVAAVNAYFKRCERQQADPYLETREKEDAFLRRIMKAISAGMRTMATVSLPTSPAPAAPLETEQDSESMTAALDFADGF